MKHRIKPVIWKKKVAENTQSEQQKEKKNFKNEDSLRDLYNNMKCINIHIIGVPEGEERLQGIENLFEKIMTEVFQNLVKKKDILVQEMQRVTDKVIPKKSTAKK